MNDAQAGKRGMHNGILLTKETASESDHRAPHLFCSNYNPIIPCSTKISTKVSYDLKSDSRASWKKIPVVKTLLPNTISGLTFNKLSEIIN